MPTYNGLLFAKTYDGTTYSGSTGGTLGATAITYIPAESSVPAKGFKSGYIALNVSAGVSGGFYANIVGGVGGATFVIAGRTAITAAGVYIMGTTGIGAGAGVGPNPFPRPGYVQLGPVAGVAGFTAAFYLFGDY